MFCAAHFDGDEFTIVGIYHCGQLMLDISIIVDIDVVRRLTRFEPNSASAFYVEPDGTVENEVLAERIREMLQHQTGADLFAASALAADVGLRLLSGDESDIDQQWLTARELHFRVQREKTLLTRSVA